VTENLAERDSVDPPYVTIQSSEASHRSARWTHGPCHTLQKPPFPINTASVNSATLTETSYFVGHNSLNAAPSMERNQTSNLRIAGNRPCARRSRAACPVTTHAPNANGECTYRDKTKFDSRTAGVPTPDNWCGRSTDLPLGKISDELLDLHTSSGRHKRSAPTVRLVSLNTLP